MSGDGCTPHRVRKYTKFSGSSCLSKVNNFIPCGLAISSCGLTSFLSTQSKVIPSLIKAANGPNGAILLTPISNRVLFCFCNRQYFGVQKAKNEDR